MSKPYEAKRFSAYSSYGRFKASGTMSGYVALMVPGDRTYTLSGAEVMDLTCALLNAREDMIRNANPSSDPLLYVAENAGHTSGT
jgi:hypothetical protein